MFELTAGDTESILILLRQHRDRWRIAELGFDPGRRREPLWNDKSRGDLNDGTVFELAADGTETVVHSFTGADGQSPQAGVILDSAGNVYGTTQYGGANGDGVVFEVN